MIDPQHDTHGMSHLHPYFHDDHPVILDEMSYKDLIADVTNNQVPGAIVNNLPHRDWAPLIKYVQFKEQENGIFKFYVPNRYNGWMTFVQFVDWQEQLPDQSLSNQELARTLLWSGNIRLHCPCPSYLYWGYQYILTQLDAAIVPEERFPTIKNPELKGVCCKHIRKTLKVLPWHLGDMASEIKKARANL